MTKKAKNWQEAMNIEEQYKDLPHGRLQWKGTDACMDFYCKCGAHLHFDVDFLYNIKCGHCNTVYWLNPHIEAIELEVPMSDNLQVGLDEDILWDGKV